MQRELAAWLAAGFLTIPAARSAGAEQQQQQQPPQQPQAAVSLDVDAAAPGTALALTRPPGGIVSVSLLPAGGEQTASVSVSPFMGDSGSIQVDLVDCANTGTTVSQPYAVKLGPNVAARVCVKVPELAPGSKYTGRLIVFAGSGAPFVRAVTLSPPVPPQGTLVLDRTTASQTVRRSWWAPWNDDPQMEVTVTIGEKSGAIPLVGLAVKLEPVTAPESGFDLASHLHFSLNGSDADDLTQRPGKEPSTRNIPAGGQSAVKIRLHNLKPGDYVIPLRFTAINAGTDDASQKLQLTVHVRDSVVWALACLAAALVVSFIATKVLTSQRRRAALLKQIRELQPGWFAVLLPVAPVVWVQAVLHKAQRLSRKFWLTSPDLIEESVNSAKSVIALLDLVHQMRDKLTSALDALVVRRAVISLDRVLSSIRTGPIDDATAQGIKARLAAFDDWVNEEKFAAVFWGEITPSLQAIRSQVALATITDPAAQSAVKQLLDAVDAALNTPPTSRADVVRTYEQYARLRILWEHRADMTAFLDPKIADTAAMFALADRRAWEKLKTSTLKIRLPLSSDPEGIEAYDTLAFAVESDAVSADTSYVFWHKVHCQWKFQLTPAPTFAERRGLKRARGAIVLTPVSLGPSIVQYFPRAGTLQVGVTLQYNGDTVDVPAVAGPTIHPSSDHAVYKILAASEVYSWLFAAGLAIATGLSTYYFKGTAWGTYQDYMTLFLWGIGLDQGKNFLQALPPK